MNIRNCKARNISCLKAILLTQQVFLELFYDKQLYLANTAKIFQRYVAVYLLSLSTHLSFKCH